MTMVVDILLLVDDASHLDASKHDESGHQNALMVPSAQTDK
jgi:hypothetical protein